MDKAMLRKPLLMTFPVIIRSTWCSVQRCCCSSGSQSSSSSGGMRCIVNCVHVVPTSLLERRWFFDTIIQYLQNHMAVIVKRVRICWGFAEQLECGHEYNFDHPGCCNIDRMSSLGNYVDPIIWLDESRYRGNSYCLQRTPNLRSS